MTSPARTKHYMLIIKCQEEAGGCGAKSISEPIEIPGTLAALFLRAPPLEGAKTGQSFTSNLAQQEDTAGLDLSECIMTVKGCDEGRSPLITRKGEELQVPGMQPLEPVLPTIQAVHQFVADIFEDQQNPGSYAAKRPYSEREPQVNRVRKWARNARVQRLNREFFRARRHPLGVDNFFVEATSNNCEDSGNCSSYTGSYTTGSELGSSAYESDGWSNYSGATLSPNAYYNELSFSASSSETLERPSCFESAPPPLPKRPRSAPSSCTTDIQSFSKQPRFALRNESFINFANYRTSNRSRGGRSSLSARSSKN